MKIPELGKRKRPSLKKQKYTWVIRYLVAPEVSIAPQVPLPLNIAKHNGLIGEFTRFCESEEDSSNDEESVDEDKKNGEEAEAVA